MKPGARRLIIGGLLLATLLAAYLADDEAAPAGVRDGAKSALNAPVTGAGEQGQRRGGASDMSTKLAAAPLRFPDPVTSEAVPDDATIDPFRSKSWVVAPPPPAPVKPVAPPLPFVYLGQVSDGEETRVFLNDQGKHLIARSGDVINGVYTVQEISRGRMTFVYQPLKEKQVLAIGDER